MIIFTKYNSVVNALPVFNAFQLRCRLSASLIHFILQIFFILPVLIAVTYVVLIQCCCFLFFLFGDSNYVFLFGTQLICNKFGGS